MTEMTVSIPGVWFEQILTKWDRKTETGMF